VTEILIVSTHSETGAASTTQKRAVRLAKFCVRHHFKIMKSETINNNPDIGLPPPVWTRLQFEARAAAADEPTMASYIGAAILSHETLCSALSFHLAEKLAGPEMGAQQVRQIISAAYAEFPDLLIAAEQDIQATLERDPACRGVLQPFLFFKGFLALQTYRVANTLWRQGRETLAFQFQSRASEKFAVDIHPATQIGQGVMLDHATDITIGETAVIGDNCSIMQGVTLGGTGKETRDRIRSLVMVY